MIIHCLCRNAYSMTLIVFERNKKKIATVLLSSLLVILTAMIFLTGFSRNNNFIRYAEFNPTLPALKKAMEIDIESYGTDHHLGWTDSLAYLSCIYYDDYSKYREKDLIDLYSRVKNGEKAESILSSKKYYKFYKEIFNAVLSGMLGEFEEKDSTGKKVKKYGLIACSPIAKGFAYSEYDDFGASRSYGYKRKHLGHDMLCETGTPIICIEDGIVECMGWNQYGGWRIGIRSKDKKRYYYYAHLRKNKPFHTDISVGKEVRAGDVIGYAGRTGYSAKENVNNIEIPHLHWGMELIFDESQKECDNEIWINLYALTKLLAENKSEVVRNPDTKEFYKAR